MTTTQQQGDVINLLERLEPPSPPVRTFWEQLAMPPRQWFLSTIIVMAWASFLLASSTLFTLLLPSPLQWVSSHTGPIAYTFQLPFALLIAGVLGQRYGTITILLVLVAGFSFMPLFASGGGPHYFSSPTMGYLLALPMVPFVLQKPLIRGFRNPNWLRGRSLILAGAALLAVTMIHLSGITGLVFYSLLHGTSTEQLWLWILHWTGQPIMYDYFFGFLAICLTRIIRMPLWFCLY